MIRKANSTDVQWIHELEKKYFKFPRTTIDFHEFAVDNEHRGYIDMKVVIDEGYIGNVLVDEEFRRMGIGDQLIDFILSEAEELNLAFVTLEVRESNHAALSLYKKHGFVEEGILRNHYSDPKENALVLTVRR